jgi:DNA-binding LacI/PurR family transcriptional regulator
MAGLKDIARESGVSVRTVGRVLAERGYVQAATRRRVVAVVRRLGYVPDRLARSLRTGSSFEVAVLAHGMDELHMARISGLERALRPHQLTTTVTFVHGAEEAVTATAELARRRPAGVVVLWQDALQPRRIERVLAERQIPVVFIDPPASCRTTSAVRIDRSCGVEQAVRYLAGAGRLVIAYFGPTCDRSRLDGYERACLALGLTPLVLLPALGSGSCADAREAGRRFPEQVCRPDAVQVYSDVVAMSFMAGLHDAGLRVPQDVAVVGFDDRRAAALAWPALTTVAQPSEAIGAAAADLILSWRAGPRPGRNALQRSVSTALVIRESA